MTHTIADKTLLADLEDFLVDLQGAFSDAGEGGQVTISVGSRFEQKLRALVDRLERATGT